MKNFFQKFFGNKSQVQNDSLKAYHRAEQTGKEEVSVRMVDTSTDKIFTVSSEEEAALLVREGSYPVKVIFVEKKYLSKTKKGLSFWVTERENFYNIRGGQGGNLYLEEKRYSSISTARA